MKSFSQNEIKKGRHTECVNRKQDIAISRFVAQGTPDGPYSELSEKESYVELVPGSRSPLSAAKILCIFLSFTFVVLGRHISTRLCEQLTPAGFHVSEFPHC